MSEIAGYFKRERYITRRLSLLVLGGTAVLISVTLAIARWRIPADALLWAIAGVVLIVVAAVVLILRAANAKFPPSATPDDLPFDDATLRKLRRRIVILEGFVVIYAFILCSIIVHAHRGEWPGVLGAAAFIVVMESALIKAIRRLKLKLRAGTVA
ncbi:MAG: hypothetical protein WBE38_12295 [Terracidiphilus sp.]|jgi:hypothetical protein